MAIVEEAIFARLNAFAGVSALVGSRIYPVTLPQNVTLPAITYQGISIAGQTRHGAATGRARPRFQVDSWGRTPLESKQLAEQVRLALQGFIGTVLGVVINGITPAGRRDVYDPEPKRFHVASDFLIWHREAVPA